jgi:hypothetical protein
MFGWDSEPPTAPRSEARREIRVAQVLRPEQLDRDVAARAAVGRPEDRRHAALSEQLDEPVAAAQRRPISANVSPSCGAGPSPARRAASYRRAPAGCRYGGQLLQVGPELGRRARALERELDRRLEPAHRRARVVARALELVAVDGLLLHERAIASVSWISPPDPRWRLLELVEDLRGEHVAADDRQVRRRVLGRGFSTRRVTLCRRPWSSGSSVGSER